MRTILLVMLCLLPPAVGWSQQGLTDSATVVAGARYAGGGVYRAFFGARYRDLWRTPVVGFVDGGKVSLEGESSDVWHSSAGGGIWLAFLSQRALVSAG